MLARLNMMAVVIILVLLSWLSKQLLDRDDQMRETIASLEGRIRVLEQQHDIVFER
jgi:cell division protein FtsB